MEVEILENGDVRISSRGLNRIRRGHLWIYRSDIKDARDVEPGSVVRVRDERGAIAGKAFYSSMSQIALRLISRGSDTIDRSFFQDRLEQADRLRRRWDVDPVLSRRVFSEADLLPGWIVDRYGDRLVVQSLIQATDRLESMLTELLINRYQPKSVLLRNDSKVRELEGLPLRQEVLGDPIPEPLTVREDGKDVTVELRSGQKTGTYLDQRENHRAARRYAAGRALDGFCYSGGFALQISDHCTQVDAVDSSRAAVELARQNVKLNGIRNVECIEANLFDFLRQRHGGGERYDTIILDPPAFAKNKETLETALRGYKEINQRALRLLQPGGILITCSCSHAVTEPLFAEMLADAAKDAGVWIRVLERRIQASDHPVLLTVPETLYLKCFILEVLY